MPSDVLLIGPLPPPGGGSRVSFKSLLDFVDDGRLFNYVHFDLPIRRRLPHGRIGRVNHPATSARVLRALLSIPRCSHVVVFASKGFAFSYGLVILATAKLLGKRFYLRLFGGRPCRELTSFVHPVRRVAEFLLAKADRISLETEAGRNDFPPRIRSKVTALTGYRPAIQLDKEAPAKEAPASLRGPFRFVFAGRVDQSKGIDTLVEAFKVVQSGEDGPADGQADGSGVDSGVKLRGKADPESHVEANVEQHAKSDIESNVKSDVEPDVRSHVETDVELHLFGPVAADIQDRIANEAGIIAHGLTDNEAYRRRLPEFDCFVYPTRYDNEGHPGAIIEALLAGVPVITSDRETILEIIQDEENGLVVPTGDVAALARAMNRAASDPDTLSRLAAGAARSGQQFREEVVIPKLLRLFQLIP